jgi:general secretion pathway protein K
VCRQSRRPRRGLALLAALWLVVMITTAGLQFAAMSRERRHLALSAVDRGRDQAALEGALATVQARLESALRTPTGPASRRSAGRRITAGPSLADPWRALDAQLGDGVRVGDVLVAVRSTDLGTVLNVNLAGERELGVLFGTLLRDDLLADRLARRIADWRDADTLSRANGAEAAEYRRAQRSVVPTNGPFRALDDLRDVLGMTPEILATIRPFLTVDGANVRVNLNAAPEPILRTLPGMSPPVLATILALRSAGRRVESIPALAGGTRGPQPGNDAAAGAYQALVRDLTERSLLDTREVALEFAVVGEPGPPTPGMVVVLRRFDDGTTDVRWRR